MKRTKLIEPGKWYNEFDENGGFKAAFYDASYYRLLGYEDGELEIKEFSDWTDRIHPDDVERVIAYSLDVCAKHPEGMDYDIEFRMMTKWGYHWFHDFGHCTRREDGSLARCDGAVFDIQEGIDKFIIIEHEQLRREVLDYMMEHDDDPVEILKNFAERLRVLIGCDQVIFRDLEETRIMVNSPAIEKTWSVPIGYCEQCEHFDAHHPMYAGGYTEMENCQEGWQGIPVFHKCPIKSSLTRIVYCDGEIAGYLAIHYVQDYHCFTEIERITLEMFARILSISLSRYSAKQMAEKAREELIARMSGGVESLYIVNPKTEQFRILRQNSHLSENYPSAEKYTKSISRYIVTDVYAPDRKKAERELSLEAIVRHLENEEEYVTRYRDVSSGVPKWYEMRAMKLSDDEIIYNFSNKNDEIIAEGFKDSLYEDQFAVMVVDLENGLLTVQKKSPWDDAFENGDCLPYKDFMTHLSIRLHPGTDAYELLNKISDIDYLRRDLAVDNKRTYTYRSAFVGKWVTIAAYVIRRHGDGTLSEVVLCFSLLDALAVTKQELQEQEVISKQFIKSFISNYDVVYKVNRSDDSYVPLKISDEIIGREYVFERFGQAMEHMLDDIVFEADRERVRRALDSAAVMQELEKSSSYSIEYRSVTDGAVHWDKMTVSILDENYVAVGFAVKNSEIILNHLQEKEYENYYALFTIDLDTGQITMLKNDSLYTTGTVGSAAPYNVVMGEFAKTLGGEAGEFFARMSNIEAVARIHAAEDKLTYVYQSVLDKKKRWIRATSYVVIRHEDGTPAVVTLGFNLMDSMSADRQEMQDKLQKAFDAAQSANKAKTDFLFNMSHDIRTPMNAIIGFTNMAMKHIEDKESVIDSLTKTQEASELLLSLINDILDMSRIESGKIHLDENEGDVYLSFANVESTMEELAKAKNLDLSFVVENITDRYVYADFSRCVRVFVNIITNAIKYTNPGGYVRVRCEQTGRRDGCGIYRYTFEDNGIGMSEEFQKRVFDEFAREETATVSGIQGTGLGLTVCRTFVNAMKGTIECQSKQGEGSTFTVTLPFRIQQGELYTNPLNGQLLSGENGESREIKIDFSGKRVLLVEDNELNREIAEDILAEEGMIVSSAFDGSVAVQMMREKGSDYYDFILMDIQMPIMNGYEATKVIRELYPKADIPIIALSANAFEEDKVASLTAGMNDHVAKPVEIGVLKETLSKYLK